MKILKEKILVILLALSGAFLLLSAVLIALNIGNFSSPVILHFDAFRGVDLFGEKEDVWGIWLTGFFMILLNLFFAETLFYRERILSYVFVGANVLISLLVFISLAVIISVN